ncbi:UNVERIFIED_CONTAM: hypothetical protein GTU68_012683, partial [Idotea baltica]|nr:hypothetical protein [Idotea baltica]
MTNIKGILDKESGDSDVKLLCISLKKYSSTVQFIFLSTSVFLFYLSYGYMLELIFTLEGMMSYGWFLTLIQFGLYSAFAFLQLLTNKKNMQRKIPLETYFLIAILTVGTMGFSNSSMGYLNFPTQVIFKSCKLIPVMIGSVLILKKTYNMTQIAACICMTVGLIWFTLADTVIQPAFNLKGVVLVCLALFCDSIIGNVQEGAMKKHDEPTILVVFYSYSLGFLLILIALVSSGTFFSALSFSLQHPWEVYGRCVFLSLAGFGGVQIVLLLIAEFGAVAAVTVTTFRKALSICLSFVLFAKPFTIHYLWGGLLVSLGVYLNVMAKRTH